MIFKQRRFIEKKESQHELNEKLKMDLKKRLKIQMTSEDYKLRRFSIEKDNKVQFITEMDPDHLPRDISIPDTKIHQKTDVIPNGYFKQF